MSFRGRGCLHAPPEQPKGQLLPPQGSCFSKGHNTSPQGLPTLGTPQCHQAHCTQMQAMASLGLSLDLP